jgi:cytochrome oxidase Cu insertion factor (SCO1/SenC/PrrC family)
MGILPFAHSMPASLSASCLRSLPTPAPWHGQPLQNREETEVTSHELSIASFPDDFLRCSVGRRQCERRLSEGGAAGGGIAGGDAGAGADGDGAGAGSVGESFDSKSLAGKVWMGSVFFSNCPGPCFRENQAVADILREIDDPDFLSISLTCDPENDTPDVLRRYADRFEADPARWKFLTGDFAVIKKVANESFLLPAEVGVHSERGVVFDRQGRLRGSYHLLQEDRVELLKKLIREVLAEEEPAS